MANLQNERIPEKFMGVFKLDRSENFEEFLSSKGVNWFLRKMMGLASVTKVFKISEENPSEYNAENLTLKKNLYYCNWKLNEAFQAEGFDGKIHQVTFSYDSKDDVLCEKHIRINDADDKGETYRYTIQNEELVMVMLFLITNFILLITCNRYFKRQ
uniref:FABP domain-containing protein n=1 Tax=Syphacia muris TaxID=451379 RepID=A0A0N5AII3_9BILA